MEASYSCAKNHVKSQKGKFTRLKIIVSRLLVKKLKISFQLGLHVLSSFAISLNVLNNGCAIPFPLKTYHIRFMWICNLRLFPHIFAAYFLILWSAYFEKNFRIFWHAYSVSCGCQTINHVHIITRLRGGLQGLHNLSLWRLKHLVTLLSYRCYINKLRPIYLHTKPDAIKWLLRTNYLYAKKLYHCLRSVIFHYCFSGLLSLSLLTSFSLSTSVGNVVLLTPKLWN